MSNVRIATVWQHIRDALICLIGLGGIAYETVLTPERPADAILVPAYLALISLGSGLPIDRLLRRSPDGGSSPSTSDTAAAASGSDPPSSSATEGPTP